VSKKFDSHQELQQKILNGVNKLADNVAATLGPRGQNVILHQKGKNPIITKDGVTVAKFISLDDPFENAAAQIIKQAAEQTNSDAGDGTTTATVLARAIYTHAQKYLLAGASATELKRGMDKAVLAIVENLKTVSCPITSQTDIEHIATISANGDKGIGNLIAMAVDQAGKDGSITIEEARSIDTSLDVVEGFRFDSGYVASAFVNNDRRHCVSYENPLFLVCDCKIEAVEEILPVLEVAARENRPLIIVAEEVAGQALAALIMNTVRGTMRIAAVKAPRYGEERRNILKDLSLAVGACLVSRETKLTLKETKLEHLGSAKSIEVQKGLTTVVDGAGDFDRIRERVEALKAELKQTESLKECEKIQERITRLISGVAIIRVGAGTEVEMIEKRHRIEDALEAVRSAQMEGIVAGGGMALLNCIDKLAVETDNSDQQFGVKIIFQAIEEPLRQMAANAGLSSDVVLEKVRGLEYRRGFNFSTGEIVDLLDDGILDPAKVTRCALQNATSAAGTLITTNHAIIEN